MAWQGAGLEDVVTSRVHRYNTVKEVIMNICRFENERVAGQVAMMMWVLWNNRNNCVWNGKKEPGRDLGVKASVMWHEWHELQNFRHTNSPPQQEQQRNSGSLVQEQQRVITQQWQKPPVGWYKCNVDAGFHNTLGRTSAGWCVRDHMGHLVMAGTSWMQ
ncbi:polynucleotidyl transferase ribonuclease H fold, partial [Trifolium medium]|nr:polynucleotidyl transferase ribonuclease H fold [Trifolium medium]